MEDITRNWAKATGGLTGSAVGRTVVGTSAKSILALVLAGFIMFLFVPALAWATDDPAQSSIEDVKSGWYLDESTGQLTIYDDAGMASWAVYDNQHPYTGSVTSAVIEDAVTLVAEGAFRYCKSLTSITFGSGVTSIGDYAFYTLTTFTSFTIPDSVTYIGNYAFGSMSLDSVTIPSKVETIGDYAFYNCVNLRSIVIPDNVTKIGENAFSWCTGLLSASIGNGVSSIEEGVFTGCTSMQSVYIASGVTSIGEGAFAGCWELSDVYYSGSQADWEKISIAESNDYLTKASVHYNSTVTTDGTGDSDTGIGTVPTDASTAADAVLSSSDADDILASGEQASSSSDDAEDAESTGTDASTGLPATGDGGHATPWIVLLLMAMIGMFGAALCKRRRSGH